MVITTLETIHRLLKIEKNEAEAALNETHKVLNEALHKLHKMGGVENTRYTNDPEYDEAYAKVVTEEVAEAKADGAAALRRFNAARDALIDFEGYQF